MSRKSRKEKQQVAIDPESDDAYLYAVSGYPQLRVWMRG